MTQIEKLKRQLEQSRETNRRLNRRCQELEKTIASMTHEYLTTSRIAANHARRAKRYADMLRDMYQGERRKKRPFSLISEYGDSPAHRGYVYGDRKKQPTSLDRLHYLLPHKIVEREGDRWHLLWSGWVLEDNVRSDRT